LSNHNLLNIQKVLRNGGVLISFSGRFSQTIIEELGEVLKKYLETEESTKSNIYNIFAIFVEQTQNIQNYCNNVKTNDQFTQIANSCIVTIGKQEDSNYIASGNLILNSDVETLIKKIKHLKELNYEGLKLFYKETRKSNIANEISAGLGLIDIARKSSFPLEYSISQIDDKVSFFTLKSLV
jgi:hypothetical protein